jgi:hypothetical protein
MWGRANIRSSDVLELLAWQVKYYSLSNNESSHFENQPNKTRISPIATQTA